jgi:hypothetical protein
MFNGVRTCLGRLITIALLLAAAYAGWRWGPLVFPRIQEWLGVGEAVRPSEVPTPSPELADSVLQRVQLLQRGEHGDRVALGGREITSVLRYSVPGLVPYGVGEPEVLLQEGRVHLRAKVALGAFPDLPDLGSVVGLLPDTVTVEIQASLLPFGKETAALVVHRIDANRIPLPRRVIPDILRAMGRRDHPGLPPEALVVPLPAGLASAYILSDSLVLSTDL